MRTQKRLLLYAGLMLLAAGGGLLAGDAQNAPPAYRVTDLGTLGGETSAARSINDQGQVVGASKLPYSVRMLHACLWDHGKKIDLGALVPQQRETESIANDINDKGQVVGALFKRLDNNYLNGPTSARAVLWDHGKVVELAGSARTQQTQALAISPSGVIVGQDQGSHSGAVMYANNKWTRLDAEGGHDEEALSINDSGVIAGSDGKNACLWDHGKKIRLGLLGFAAGINAKGEVAITGAIGPSKPPHAFLWRGGHLQDLGTLGGLDSFAYSINSSGQVVGESERSNKDPILKRYAFLYTDGKMIDLTALLPPNSGWTLVSANHINDRGQIVGTGLIHGIEHAYLLTPGGAGVR